MRERRHTFRVLTRDLLSRPPNIETIDVILHQKIFSYWLQLYELKGDFASNICTVWTNVVMQQATYNALCSLCLHVSRIFRLHTELAS
jgi:hypothetical protein